MKSQNRLLIHPARPRAIAGLFALALAACQTPAPPPAPAATGGQTPSATGGTPSSGGTPASPNGTGGGGSGGGSGGALPSADVAIEAPASEAPAAPSGEVAPDAPAPEVGAEAAPTLPGAIVWNIDNLQAIGGHRTTVLGAPKVIDTPGGKAVSFDGVDDALLVDEHPLAGVPVFTVEVVFRPDAGGPFAQRFFHLSEGGTDNRVLFETRLPEGTGKWILDVFIESAAGAAALYTPRLTHDLGQFYHLAAVVDGKQIRHYVNHAQEGALPLGFQPHRKGQTAIGMRINRRYFFKGAIRTARFTPRALTPAEFLPVP